MHYKIQSLSKEDIDVLELASARGANAATEIRGLLKDMKDAEGTDSEELEALYKEMDQNLHDIYKDEVGKYEGSKSEKAPAKVASKVTSKAHRKTAAAKRAEGGVSAKVRAKAKAADCGCDDKDDNGSTQKRMVKKFSEAAKSKPVAKKATPKRKAAPKPRPTTTAGLKGNAKKAAEMRMKREEMLSSVLRRKDLQELSEKDVLTIARNYQDLRMNVSKDERTASKQRVSPTPENLVRWMRNPGSFDLIGVDSAKATAPTANLKIKTDNWWKSFGFK